MELEELNFEKILQKASKSGNPGVVVKGVTSTDGIRFVVLMITVVLVPEKPKIMRSLP